MKKLIHGFFATTALAVAIAFTGCVSDPQSPGLEYMPDMYRSQSYKAYAVNPNNGDSIGGRRPVAGTIPRGTMYTDYMPYEYPNTNEGYEAAGANLKNPVALTPAVLAEGKRLYGLFCIHCHGEAGDGQGWLVSSGKFGGVPSYSGPQLKDLPEGKMYHTLMYGKNMMGSHASQVNMKERWSIIHYVQTLQKGTAAAPADTAVAAKQDTVAKK